MPLTKETINIDVTIPDDTEFETLELHFTLSVADADVADGVTLPPQTAVATLGESGDGSIDLWPPDRGFKGSHYNVVLIGVVSGEKEIRQYKLGKIQPGDGEGPFTLAELLSEGAAIVEPAFYSVLTQAEYDAAIQARIDAEAAAAGVVGQYDELLLIAKNQLPSDFGNGTTYWTADIDGDPATVGDTDGNVSYIIDPTYGPIARIDASTPVNVFVVPKGVAKCAVGKSFKMEVTARLNAPGLTGINHIAMQFRGQDKDYVFRPGTAVTLMQTFPSVGVFETFEFEYTIPDNADWEGAPWLRFLFWKTDANAIATSTIDLLSIRVIETTDTAGQIVDGLAQQLRTFESFGAWGNTVISSTNTFVSGADDTAAIQAAFDWMKLSPGRELIAAPGAVYRLTGPISAEGHVNVDATGGTFFVTENTDAFDFNATLNGPYNLATDYVVGSLTLDLAGSPLPEAPAPGTIMKIVSDALDPTNRDRGSEAYQYRTAEFFTVGVGSTTTSLVLVAPLQFTRSINPTSAAGDEGSVASYTTARAARVIFADNSQVFRWVGGEIRAEGGHSESGWNGAPISVCGYVRPIVDELKLDRYYYSGLLFAGTYGARAKAPLFLRGENDPGEGQLAYGVVDNGWFTQITGLRSHDVRHAYTTGNPTTLAGETDLKRLIAQGKSLGCEINGQSTGGTSTHWDTHHGSYMTTLRDCVASEGGEYSLGLRGNFLRCFGHKAHGTGKGIYVFTEYDSGQPDEDYFTNGKEIDDFTSATVVDAEVDVVEEPVYCSHARMRLSGQGRYRSNDHCAIYNLGGELIIDGHHEFITRAGAVAHGRIGCIDMDAVSVYSAFDKAVTIIEGTVIIDASESDAASLYALNLAANTELIVRGRLKLFLPNDADGFQTGTGAVRCENGGVIEISVVNGPDESVGSALEFDGCRVKTSDGVVDWFGVDGWHQIFHDTLFGGSHTGDTVRTAIADPDCQDGCYVLDQDGAGGRMRYVFEGSKVGSAGTAELQIRSNGDNFVWNGTIAAADSNFIVTVDVIFESTGNQKYFVTLEGFDAAGTTSRDTVPKPETQVFTTTGHAAILNVTLANAADTVTCDRVQVFASKGGVI